MGFELLACDMDGTALDGEKRLSAGNIAAMERALERGKHVVFCTGRNIPLALPYINMVRGMRYAVLSAGANVKDISAGVDIIDSRLNEKTVLALFKAAEGVPFFPVLYRGDVSCGPAWGRQTLDEYHVTEFAETYRRFLKFEPGLCEDYLSNPTPLRKLNFFFTNPRDKDTVYDRIRNYDVTFTAQSECYMEITAAGVTKESGLAALCQKLGIGLDQCIAVGDAANDIPMLRAAGLGVAVANATDEALAAADTVVSDCGHDGVAEAIRRFLLA